MFKLVDSQHVANIADLSTDVSELFGLSTKVCLDHVLDNLKFLECLFEPASLMQILDLILEILHFSNFFAFLHLCLNE